MSKSTAFGLLAKDKSRPLHYRFLKRQRHRANRWMAASSKIPNDPVLDPQQFGWTQPLVQSWQAIRDEALAVYQHLSAIPPLREISPDHRGIMSDNSWRSFFLIGYGNRVEANIARAPRTARLVEAIPGLNSAFFSILAPGSVITPHRGVSKGFVTAHLGLKVPRDREACWMRVDDKRLHWQEGKWLIFDDTYEHEVRNDSDEWRIILLCQVERPLRAPGSWMAAAMMAYIRRSSFVQEAKDNIAEWETSFAKAERGEL
ncbi:aspartyl/asparaginyl beta-hydroxylase domain-containing protein [uncultured Erythrobacter sp.]|uniref:aspartyl/asparaginyl beta-hydroxylase domain-containing protein n=1 Tax=uncultured Erythrobacter sp. TaxID=263913 RepID=UPI00262AF127|nr:aspartyl/asparaginyl beta-hydroxylase domain-containing protein [uncultured Erythrobacter sp.]